MKTLTKNLKYLKFQDFIDILILIFVFICFIPYKIYLKLRRKNIWLFCESSDTARDNGYYFFEYININHTEINSYYVIDKKGTDYKKVCMYKNVIQYRSFKHWLYYLCSKYIISSQKSGNPSPALFYFLHVSLGLMKKRIFLQHGVIYNDLEYLYYNVAKFKMFVCGAKPEYDFVSKNFNYPNDCVKYTGLARFDTLHDAKVNKGQVLIMPSWRSWLGRETNFLSEKENFKNSEYYKKWTSLISNKELIDYIEENDITIYFYPHMHMIKYLNEFVSASRNIKIVSNKDIDIQDLLKTSALLITDYSSVFTDFAYMKKPIIYYQFDNDDYREKQYNEGYFSYEKDGFGPCYKEESDVIDNVIKYAKTGRTEKKYLDKMDSFFELHDDKNCERIYNQILNLE